MIVKNLLILTAVSSIISSNAYALMWDTDYGASLTAGHDDNFRLLSSNEVDTTFTNFDVFVMAEGAGELSDVQVRASISNDSYSDSSVTSRSTSALTLSGAQRNERLSGNITASLTSDPTIETELLDTGVLVDSTRDLLNMSAGLSYSLDERSSLVFGINLTDVSYDTPNLIEYKNRGLNIGWRYQLDEASNLAISMSASQYEPTAAATTDNNNVNISYQVSPIETTSYNFSVGTSKVDSPSSSQTSSNYSASVNHQRDQLNSFSLLAARSFQASGLGIVRRQDELTLNWMHAFKERLQGTLSVAAVLTDGRDYASIEPGISYNMSRNIVLSGNYRLRKQNSTLGDADSNALFFTFSYSH